MACGRRNVVLLFALTSSKSLKGRFDHQELAPNKLRRVICLFRLRGSSLAQALLPGAAGSGLTLFSEHFSWMPRFSICQQATRVIRRSPRTERPTHIGDIYRNLKTLLTLHTLVPLRSNNRKSSRTTHTQNVGRQGTRSCAAFPPLCSTRNLIHAQLSLLFHGHLREGLPLTLTLKSRYSLFLVPCPSYMYDAQCDMRLRDPCPARDMCRGCRERHVQMVQGVTRAKGAADSARALRGILSELGEICETVKLRDTSTTPASRADVQPTVRPTGCPIARQTARSPQGPNASPADRPTDSSMAQPTVRTARLSDRPAARPTARPSDRRTGRRYARAADRPTARPLPRAEGGSSSSSSGAARCGAPPGGAAGVSAAAGSASCRVCGSGCAECSAQGAEVLACAWLPGGLGVSQLALMHRAVPNGLPTRKLWAAVCQHCSHKLFGTFRGRATIRLLAGSFAGPKHPSLDPD